MPSVGWDRVIPAVEWLQTYALDHTATGNGIALILGADVKKIMVHRRTDNIQEMIDMVLLCVQKVSVHKLRYVDCIVIAHACLMS
jgi:ABC-type tungstate transport system permease subunit